MKGIPDWLWLPLLLLTLINLLVANDYTSYWAGAEVESLYHLVTAPSSLSFFERIIKSLFTFGELGNPLILRLVSSIPFILAAFTHFWLAKPLFGKDNTLLQLGVIANMVLILFYSKVGSADILLLSCLWIAGLVHFRLMKRSQWWLYGLMVGVLIIASLIQPILAFIYGAGLYIGNILLHPKGKLLLKQFLVWLVPLTILLLITFTAINFNPTNNYFEWSQQTSLSYFAWQFVGILPFLGFALAGLLELINKLKKGEELSIIYTIWLGAAIISGSLVTQIILGFIIAKQLVNYFKPNYPYQRLVKAGMILQLILGVSLGVLILTTSYTEYGGLGFRSGIMPVMFYSAGALFGIIGLYANRFKFILGSLLFTPALTFLFYWIMLHPFVEHQRSYAQQIFKAIPINNSNPIVVPKSSPTTLYMYGYLDNLTILEEVPEDTNAYYELTTSPVNRSSIIDSVKTRDNQWQETTYYLLNIQDK